MMNITATPQSVNKKQRVLKERERRSKEKEAFHELRRTLEATDSKAFWNMEKVVIADGAAYLIEKLAGGSHIPERKPILIEAKNPDMEDKLDRIQVEKQRRHRESEAIKKLKSTLITYSKDAHEGMDRVETLTFAAHFLKTISNTKPSCTPRLIPIGTGASTLSSSPSVISSPATSVDSGNWSPGSACLSPELLLLASIMQPPHFFTSPRLAFEAPALHDDKPSTTKKADSEDFWRPWE